MRRFLFSTSNNFVPLFLRLALAGVMLPHGAQKVLGWYGGHGFQGTIEIFTKFLHIPYFLAVLAIAAESLGSIALALGLLTRIAALGIGTNMVVAALLVHRPNGFFMNWFGNQQGEGFEYHILAASIALVLLFKGGGALSIDRMLAANEEEFHAENA